MIDADVGDISHVYFIYGLQTSLSGELLFNVHCKLRQKGRHAERKKKNERQTNTDTRSDQKDERKRNKERQADIQKTGRKKDTQKGRKNE